jgi:N6-adenosine-specific RNA methylase IME4
MNGLPQRNVLSGNEGLSRLTALVCAFPVARRGAILQAAVSFEPASTLAQEFAVGPVRAAFAECWEARFGRAVPVRAFRALLAPPVPIKTVLEFARLNIITDAADVEQALDRLVSFLASEVRQTSEESQRSLFPCTECECAEASPASANGAAVAGDMVASLEELTTAGRKYPTIYADPPWAYDNVASRAAAENHYPTMSLAEICDLPISNLAAANAHLHLWTTNGFLREAFDVLDAWGFAFKSCLVWVKDEIGMGNYWRVSHEFLLLGVRGRLTFADRTLPSWIQAPRTAHSRKPGVVRMLIERVSPGPYLELFGREELPNSRWTVFGNRIERRLF